MKRKPLFGTWLLFEIGFFTVQTAVAFSQTTPSQAPAANALLAQLGTAFSGAVVVQHVQLNGNATWHAGSLNDSGTVTLTASSDGSWQMLLDLSGIGKKSESRTGAGLEATCQWSGSDGVLHPIAPGNCWKPATWFLPGLSLQSSIIPAYTATADLGNSTVGSGATFYRHLQGWIDYGLF